MKRRTLPPEAIPIREETNNPHAVFVKRRLSQKRNGFRTVLRGFFIGISIPFAAVAVADISENFATIKEKISSSWKPTSPATGNAGDPYENKIPEEIHCIINELPEITNAEWQGSTLSFLYRGKGSQITFKEVNAKMTLSALTIGCTDFRINRSIDSAHLATILENASHTLDHLKKEGFDIPELTSDDGARFEFTTTTNGREQRYVTTINGLHRVLADYPATHDFPHSRALIDPKTNDAIDEVYLNEKVEWTYRRNSTTRIIDTFKEYTLYSRQEDLSPSQSTLTTFHPGSSAPQYIAQWKFDRDPLSGSVTQSRMTNSRNFLRNGDVREETDWVNYTKRHYDHGQLFVEMKFKEIERVIHGKTVTIDEPVHPVLYHKGQPIRMYPEEKKINPALTPESYIQRIAAALDTHEKLHIFATCFWQYTHDSPDPKNPLLKGTEENHRDYVQTPEETIQRVENEKMLGDCDDFAEFLRTVSRLQKKNAHCIYTIMDSPSGKPGGHVFCSWVEKRNNGRFDGFAIEMNIGLRQNGISYSPDMENEEGTYHSIAAANRAVFRQYPKGLSYHRAPDHIAAQRTSNHRMYDYPITSNEFDPTHLYEPASFTEEWKTAIRTSINGLTKEQKTSIINALMLMGACTGMYMTRKRKDAEE